MLAHLLAFDRLFQYDFIDGTLEQQVLSPYPLHVSVSAKLLAHWLTTALPLVLMAPVLALLLQMPHDKMFVLCVSLVLGTPLVTCIGAMGAAFTMGLKSRGALIALLIFPLYMPIFIFAVGSVLNVGTLASVAAPLAWLGALLALALPLSPLVIAAIVRININS